MILLKGAAFCRKGSRNNVSLGTLLARICTAPTLAALESKELK